MLVIVNNGSLKNADGNNQTWVIEIVVTPGERMFSWAGLGHFEKIPARLYSIIGLVAAY